VVLASYGGVSPVQSITTRRGVCQRTPRASAWRRAGSPSAGGLTLRPGGVLFREQAFDALHEQAAGLLRVVPGTNDLDDPQRLVLTLRASPVAAVPGDLDIDALGDVLVCGHPSLHVVAMRRRGLELRYSMSADFSLSGSAVPNTCPPLPLESAWVSKRVPTRCASVPWVTEPTLA
jgi:hypothetical protein